MRLLVFLVLIATTLISGSISGQEVTEKPYDWQPIFGFKMEGITVYYDRNSIETKYETSEQKFNVGDILFVFDEPKEITTATKTVLGYSEITHMIIECKSRTLAPIYDLLIGVKMPTDNDVALAQHEYKKEDMVTLSKKDPLYHTLCPNYI